MASDASTEVSAEKAFATAVAEYDIPGLIVGVTQNGQHSFYATGLASREEQRPVTPDTLFELGSISKIFNVTLAALAEEHGQLSLSDSVSQHLGVLEGTAFGGLTLMDLATHNSGGLPLQVPDDAKTTDDLIAWLADWQPAQPGARSYSNISIGLLGHVTAQAMNQSFAAAVQARLLPLLGMTNTWIDVPATATPDYAFGYDRDTNAPIRVNPGVLADEAYGIKSSARDMLRLLDAQMDQSGLPDDLAAAIVQTQRPQRRTDSFEQAMIWERYPLPIDLQQMIKGNSTDFILNAQPASAVDPASGKNGDVILSKTGATNGFGAYVAVIPSRQLGIVVLANRNFPNEARVTATYHLIEQLLLP
ncbi:class C beta-lactamase [Paracoccus amoyensis]|nr:class C beta-lactamase [Paracoccus amoyensis]